MIIQTVFPACADARQQTINNILAQYRKTGKVNSLKDFHVQEVFFYSLFPSFNLSMFHSELNLKERHMSISRNIITANQRIFHACYSLYEGGQPQDILYDSEHIWISLRDRESFQRFYC